MYIIRYLDDFMVSFISDKRRKYVYFTGFYQDKFRSYGNKAKAVRFSSRSDAESFLREQLGGREGHEVVRA